jgi:hypothetical protein
MSLSEVVVGSGSGLREWWESRVGSNVASSGGGCGMRRLLLCTQRGGLVADEAVVGLCPPWAATSDITAPFIPVCSHFK